MKKIWFCKIGEVEDGVLPAGADLPMRNALSAAYTAMTGLQPEFCFSGWGGELTPIERAVSENRHPNEEELKTLEDRAILYKFYAVHTDDELISAMYKHLVRLQSRLPREESFRTNVREG